MASGRSNEPSLFSASSPSLAGGSRSFAAAKDFLCGVAHALSACATPHNNSGERDGKQAGTKRHLLPYCREGQDDVPSFVAFLPAW